ncbi:hypothetical protein [Chelativorans intermedius]|uniref:Uncharacterized protein n=1 Tax=Chelativorans intermedius TaxID=515947 RepID=A0ABV6D854_9HYPH|nr:hypothetical protein [Chelativorans intermedius]MCT8999881.1 hypothetical protein [Chelativorans intermedius]
MKGKEVTKFFAGFAANQVLTHGALATAGIQFSLFGITYDQRLNTSAVVVWAIILLLLVYYAWVKR